MSTSYRDAKPSLLVATLLVILTCVAYLFTLCPTVYWYDSGELASACYHLGIAHPTGYPLYTILGRICCLLPIGDVAFRLNLMSALCGALTVGIVYLVIRTLALSIRQKNLRTDGSPASTKRVASEAPAIVSALVLAFSPLFWAQTAIAEVYTLHTLFVVLLLFILAQWTKNRPSSAGKNGPAENDPCHGEPRSGDRYLYLFAFVLGLSLGHHLSMLMFVPAFVAFVIMADRHILKRGPLLALSILLVLLGLSVDLFLFIRAGLNPLQNWGNPDTWGRWWDVVTGAEIRARPTRYVPHSVPELFTLLGRQFLLPGIVLGVIGVWASLRRHKPFLVCGSLFCAAMIAYILRNFDFLEDQYLPVFLIFSIWVGLGIKELALGLFWLSRKRGHGAAAMSWACLVLVVCLPVYLFAHNCSSVNLRGHRTARLFGEQMLQNVDSESMILSEGSNIPLLLSYLQGVEGKSSDVTSIYLFLTDFDWYREQMSERRPRLSMPKDAEKITEHLVEQNPDVAFYYSPFSKETSIDPARLVPHGFLFQVHPDRTVLSRKEVIEHFRIHDDFYGALQNPLNQADKDILTEIHGAMGLCFERKGMYEEALREYTRALEVDSLNPGVHYDLGSLAMRTEAWGQAIERFRKVLELEPGNLQTRYLFAQCLIETGSLGQASQEMERIIRADLAEPRLLLQLGVVYGQMGKTERAADCFEKGLRLSPSDVDLLYNAGIAKAKSGSPEKAMALLQQATSVDSTRVDIMHALASIYAGQMKYSKAERYYHMALRQGPDPSILEDMGFMYRQAGDLDRAAEAWEAALRLDPGNIRLEKELGHLREAIQAQHR